MKDISTLIAETYHGYFAFVFPWTIMRQELIEGDLHVVSKTLGEYGSRIYIYTRVISWDEIKDYPIIPFIHYQNFEANSLSELLEKISIDE